MKKKKSQCFQISFPPMKLIQWLSDRAMKPGVAEAQSHCRRQWHLLTMTFLCN